MVKTFFIPALKILFYAPLFCGFAQKELSDDQLTDFGEYDLGKLVIEYANPRETYPSLSPIGDAYLEIGDANASTPLSSMFSAENPIPTLSLDDLQKISQVPLQYLKFLGYEGMAVSVDPRHVDPLSAIDLREGNQSDLRILVWLSHVDEISWENENLSANKFSFLKYKTEGGLVDLLSGRRAFQRQDLQFLKRLEKLNSQRVSLKIGPSEKPGFIIPKLMVRSKRTDHLKLFAMNAGTKTTGRWLMGATYAKEDLTAREDKLDLTAVSSNTGESGSLSIGYQIPVSFPDIVTLKSRLAYSYYDASSFAFEQVDFEGSTKSLDLSLDWKPLETEWDEQSIAFHAGLVLEKLDASNSFLSGKGSVNEVAPYLGISHRLEMNELKSFTKMRIRKNLNSVDSQDALFLGGVGLDGKYLRMEIEHFLAYEFGDWLNETYPMSFLTKFDNHTLVAHLRSNFALDGERHLPQRQFINGGSGSVRGYPESVSAGDSGLALSLEYVCGLPELALGDELGNATVDFIPFWDWGMTKVNDPFSYESEHTLSSVGIGQRFRSENGLTLQLEYAKPIREIVSNGTVRDGTRSGDHQIHAKVMLDF